MWKETRLQIWGKWESSLQQKEQIRWRVENELMVRIPQVGPEVFWKSHGLLNQKYHFLKIVSNDGTGSIMAWEELQIMSTLMA